MKAKIEDREGFRPFRLVIEVETENEARALWHRFNLTVGDVRDAYGKGTPTVPFPEDNPESDITCQEVWEEMDRVLNDS